MPKTLPIEQRLLNLIEQSDSTLRDISEASGVPYLVLHRWTTGRVKSLKLNHGEALWEFFTGMKFQ